MCVYELAWRSIFFSFCFFAFLGGLGVLNPKRPHAHTHSHVDGERRSLTIYVTLVFFSVAKLKIAFDGVLGLVYSGFTGFLV